MEANEHSMLGAGCEGSQFASLYLDALTEATRPPPRGQFSEYLAALGTHVFGGHVPSLRGRSESPMRPEDLRDSGVM